MKAFDFEKPEVAVEEPAKRRPTGSLLGEMSDRLARTFSPVERDDKRDDRRVDKRVDKREKPGRQREPAAPRKPSPHLERATAPRFAVVRQGYDSAAVDEYLAELEQEVVDLDQELADLQSRVPSETKVASEIERLGEQTAKILLAAHDQAHETTARAQAEADRCISDAAANAVKLTDDAKRQMRQLESDHTKLRQERARLLDDIRSLSGALSSLAKDASGRFPAEGAARSSDTAGSQATAGAASAEIKISRAAEQPETDG